MPRHVVIMWLLAGGGTLIGATLTYLATRSTFAPGIRLRSPWRRVSSLIPGMFSTSRSQTLSRQRGFSSEGHSARRAVSPAFDEYRMAEIAKLEGEEREFRTFLQTLRDARDREEFESFVRAKSGRPGNTSVTVDNE